MSVQQAAPEVLAALTRARLLFASAPQPLPSGTPLDAAAGSAVAVGQRAAGLSWELVAGHGDFIGAQRLDTIVAQSRSLAQRAAAARSPAAQRMALALGSVGGAFGGD